MAALSSSSSTHHAGVLCFSFVSVCRLRCHGVPWRPPSWAVYIYIYTGVNDVERTVSAMVKLTQENDDSWVYVVDYGMVPPSPRPSDCGMPVDRVCPTGNSGLHSSDPFRAEQKTPRSVSCRWCTAWCP